MKTRRPAPATPRPRSRPSILGDWRFDWMEAWDVDPEDPDGPSTISFRSGGLGEFSIGALGGRMDCRYSHENGTHRADFSWEGNDDADLASGRGWARLEADGILKGYLAIHFGDHSEFTAVLLKGRRRI